MLIVRLAGPHETSDLIRLRALWTAEQAGAPVDDPDFEDRYRAWQENNKRIMFVAELDGTPIGMLNLMVFERMPKPGKKSSCWVYLGNVFVSPDHRNRGVGGKLLEAATTYSQDISAARMVLSPSAQSQNFYRRHGFVPAEELLVKTSLIPTD
ncbi:GNAT family N-acetyltransferase [Paenarthrobacter sp. Z7-10]|uniref:GNAT family N-acetyltransferase n=1 Tax=Paenarthrobacter sp. Z7-10 TaxID=2787635 RepID=UPI0022A96E4E|nr:GNAT family N-acetyltransferase [Paenarthrobacter sp. Z7-10]MCZ2404734.1 GNAT family N-acetyltransferase [Paenarthrobacter sp. Z7-10]